MNPTCPSVSSRPVVAGGRERALVPAHGQLAFVGLPMHLGLFLQVLLGAGDILLGRRAGGGRHIVRVSCTVATSAHAERPEAEGVTWRAYDGAPQGSRLVKLAPWFDDGSLAVHLEARYDWRNAAAAQGRGGSHSRQDGHGRSWSRMTDWDDWWARLQGPAVGSGRRPAHTSDPTAPSTPTPTDSDSPPPTPTATEAGSPPPTGSMTNQPTPTASGTSRPAPSPEAPKE